MLLWQWKTAYICPVHKKGARDQVTNYRPISLTSSMCRLMEKILLERLIRYLLENSLLSKEQHGFLPGRSTTTQLLQCLDHWISDFEEKTEVHAIYTDFKKAFDKVSHNKLIEILHSYGIQG